MSRITKPLTATEVSSAKPEEKEYTLRDGGGLYLRIKPNGSKIWLFDYYRPITKKRTNMGFGVYPDLSLSAARQKRDEVRRLLAQGIDPQTNQKEQLAKALENTGNTFEKVAGKWFELKKSKVTSNHAAEVWRSFENYIFPILGNVPVSSLTAKQTISALETVKNKGYLSTLHRLIQRMNDVMSYAVNTGLIDINPISKIGDAFEKPETQHMLTIPPKDLPALMGSIAESNAKPQTRNLIEWSLHTMVRPSEAAKARWDEIDLEQKLWIIPAARMKKRKEHQIPLTIQTLSILEMMRTISGNSEFIFPHRNDTDKPMDRRSANNALKKMGYKDSLVAHGLRSIGSTALNEQGYDPDIIEVALSHLDKNAVRRAYNRADYLERRRPMMQWWSNHIEQAAQGNINLDGKCGLKVVNN